MAQSAPATPAQFVPKKMPNLMKATFLGPSEEFQWEARPSGWLYFPGPILFLFLVVLLDVYLLNRATGGGIGWLNPPSWLPSFLTNFGIYSIQVMVGLVLLLIAIFYLAIRWFKRATTVYAITNTRLIRQRGILGRDFDEVQLRQIRGLDVHQTLFQRIFKYGTIRISAEGYAPSDVGNEQWVGFPNPVKFQQMVEGAQERSAGMAPITTPRR